MANLKKKYTKMTTAIGVVEPYPKLSTPDSFEGQIKGFKVEMQFSPEEAKRLIGLCEQEIVRAKKEEYADKSKWKTEPFMPYKQLDNGNYVFKFTTGYEQTDKVGVTTVRKVTQLDRDGNNINDVVIDSGTRAVIHFAYATYYTNSMINGVKFYINAIQVTKLIERSSGTYGAISDPEDDSYTPFEEADVA